MKNNNKIVCSVNNCIYNIDGKNCSKDEIKVSNTGIEKSEASCESFEKYTGFSSFRM